MQCNAAIIWLRVVCRAVCRDHSLTSLSRRAVHRGDPVVVNSTGQSPTTISESIIILLANLLRESNKCAVHSVRLSCTTGTVPPKPLVMK